MLATSIITRSLPNIAASTTIGNDIDGNDDGNINDGNGGDGDGFTVSLLTGAGALP